MNLRLSLRMGIFFDIMVIELSGVQFELKSYAWFQKSIERPARVRSEITSMISDQNCTKRSSITTHYIHLIQDLVTSNILLMQYWAGLKLNSSIFWGGKSKSFGNKSSKICHRILFVYYFPAIWLVTLNKPWNLIGCYVFSVASSLAGKKMWFKAKNGAIRE